MKQHYDNIDEYISDLKKEIAANDKCANHYYNLGMAFLHKRDFVAAEEAFLDALRNSPHLAEAYVQLGGICLERGDLDGCLGYNEQAASCRPKFSIAQIKIEFLHLQRGEPDKAIAALNKALSWNPNFIQARNAMATALFMKENFADSEKISREIISSEPNFAPAWNNLALALMEQNKVEEAIAAIDKAVELGFVPSEKFLEELKPHRK